MSDQWEPSKLDAYLEALRRLSGAPVKSPRFPDVIRHDDVATDKRSDAKHGKSGGCSN